ncbi:MAG: hypothetical protein H7Z17_10165 [Fuerstia sp.]|nr:hypothetical protein [Fuerstiella sp.]
MQDNPYGATSYSQQSATPELKHSGVGIASFVLSLLSGICLFALFAVAGYMESQSPGGMNEEDPTTMLLGLALIAAGMGQFLAFILGAVGLFQPNRKKIFAVLGTIFSLLAVLAFGGLMVLGFVMQAQGG